MLRFENEYVLYALLLVPVLVGLYVYIRYRQRKIGQKYGEMPLLKLLMPDSSPKMQNFKFILVCLIFSCLVFALANPQMGSGVEKGKRKGIDIMLCVDVSNSMLAKDYAPNRLEAAKRAMSLFVEELKGDRIGIVVFAGNAFVQLPITSDYAAAKMFISNISTRMISTQGTDIATAIDKAAASMLPQSDVAMNPNQPLTQKVIVVISDGEDHFTEAIDMASAVAKKGILVYTIGVGNSLGEPIPLRASSGGDYMKDKEGNTVITRLNEQILREISQAGNGSYIHANNAHIGLDILTKDLNKLEKAEIEDVIFSRYESRYYVPLWIALVLLIIEILLYNKKMFRFKGFSWLKNKQLAIFISLVFIGSFQHLASQTTEEIKALREGNRQYSAAAKLEKEAENMEEKNRESNKQEIAVKKQQAQQLYEQASTNYLKSNTSTGNYYKSMYNQAASLYKQGKYEEAAKEMTKVIENTNVSDKVKSKAYHNLGNSLMQQEKYSEAIDAYKRSLKANPSDMDTKYNMEYAKKKLAVQQQQQQNQQQDQKQNKGDQDNKEQQGQNEQNKKEQQDKNHQQNQNQDKNPQDNQKQKGEGRQQDNQEAKRKLDALQTNEKKTQEKAARQENQQSRPVKQEKNW
jgi:Ca-activated chloride channel family protein